MMGQWRSYKFMIKSHSGNVQINAKSYCLPSLSSNRSHHHLSHRTQPLSRYQKQSHSLLPPAPPQSLHSDPQLLSHRARLLRWKKQSREKQLQAVYDQNIRIFVSLSKQKSVYSFQQRKKEERRPLPQRLLPLPDRTQLSRAL